MTTHAEARKLAGDAIRTMFGREPLGGEAEGLAGVAWLETNYAQGWKGGGKGSRNLGAIQCGSGWNGPRFSYVDTHPNPDGTNTRYQVDFRAYDTDAAAWLDLCRVVYVNRGRASVRAAAIDRDWFAMSREMHRTGYYEGYGKTVADRIANHHRALSKAIALADNTVARVVAPTRDIPETVRSGMRGEVVKLMQRELGIAADGIAGPVTIGALRKRQASLGLTVDGVCGPKTWERLFTDENQVTP